MEDLTKVNNVHFIGIGGIGISAIARMMESMGKNVSGQDMQDSEIIHKLGDIGIDISISQSFDNIPKDTDLVVYTIAIENYDKELFDKLKSSNVFKIASYPEMLGIVSKDKYTIAVSGTHGKTTTTGMLAQIFKDSGNDPTVVIGSLLKNGSNFIHGESKYFITEACEYRRSFLNINPNILVITNIDEDHLDYYKDIEDIKSAFRELAMKVPSDGFVICNPSDKNISDVVRNIKAKVVDYSGFFDEDLKLKIPGIHNKKNAASAMAVALSCNISEEISKKALSEFSGTWRRFEFKGKLLNKILIYDDYAHHPKEISSTLEGFRELYPKNEGWHITVVFQPHLFSRTKMLLNDFATSFNLADQVMILPIYYAREVDDGTISSEILELEINKHLDIAEAFSNFTNLENNLLIRLKNMNNKNIIITMGAGEAYKIGDFLLSINS